MLTRDSNNTDALKYRGELEVAFTTWKARQGHAKLQDFESSAAWLQRALAANPDDQEARLTLAGLCLERASWERAQGLDAGPSLVQGRTQLFGLLNHRPKWGEALVLQAAMSLEEAESLHTEARLAKAGEARQAFETAFALNPNLTRVWQTVAERAARFR